MHNISSAITNLNIDVKQLPSESNEREKPHHFDCGLSSQQFPLSSEEELQMLDTGLQQKEIRDSFMAMVTRLMDNNPKTSMQYVLSHLLTPEVASALTNRFLSSSVKGKDLEKLHDIATQGYFHDVGDKLIKRNKRKQDQVNCSTCYIICVRTVKRKLNDYLCTSEELEVAEVEAGFAPVEFPVVNISTGTFSPIASSSSKANLSSPPILRTSTEGDKP
ncbi:unnamed protein product [Schistosoma curassoni]|uniref:DUF4806 domain-containing protein n=1 Tax=Schistosoma curassoni TaxID=6186 RepID=A0A183L4M3_9TREM|nr:unnamed protein product [Schistosoma curassoni]